MNDLVAFEREIREAERAMASADAKRLQEELRKEEAELKKGRDEYERVRKELDKINAAAPDTRESTKRSHRVVQKRSARQNQNLAREDFLSDPIRTGPSVAAGRVRACARW